MQHLKPLDCNHIARTIKVWHNHIETTYGRWDLSNTRVIYVDVYGTDVNKPNNVLLVRKVVLLRGDDPISERLALLRDTIESAKRTFDRGNKKFYGYY